MRHAFTETLEPRQLLSATPAAQGVDLRTAGRIVGDVVVDVSPARTAAAVVRKTVVQRISVHEFGTTRIVAGVTITGYWQDGKSTGPLRGVTTGADGRANMTGPSAAHWVLTLSRNGYQTRPATISAKGNGSISIPIKRG